MRIAVWNTAFLGDAVLTLPLIRVLKAAYPDADIDFYTRGGLDALFAAQPEISHVYGYDKRGKAKGLRGFWRLARAVRSRGYDIWICAHLSLRSTVMARLSGAARRIGYTEATGSSLLLTDRVPRGFAEQQEIERLLALLGPLNIPARLTSDIVLTWPEIIPPLEAERGAAELLAPLPPGPLLGVHPGSVWPTKRWTPEGFADIARRAAEAGANVVLLASPDEVPAAREVLRLAGLAGHPRFLDISGKTSLPVLAALVGRLQCYLTNDSGPMHLAWGQHAPVTALFGPTVRELGFEPRGNSRIMEVELDCRPCGLHGHNVCPKEHFRCMRDIDPDDVWRDVEAKLFPWKTGERERRLTLPGDGDASGQGETP